MLDTLATLVLALLALVTAAIASAHATLSKRDVRAAIGWVGLIWMVPFVGALLYGLLGINRIHRRATELRPHRPPAMAPPDTAAFDRTAPAERPTDRARHLAAVARLIDAITPTPLTSGNAVRPLVGGEAAFTAMLEAIGHARRTIGMGSYIFDNDAAGHLFADALAAAAGRGVAVRVLIDGVGARYSHPPVTGMLRRRGIPVALFLPTFVPLHLAYANLRNHRKILVVDGRTGFTGGLNVRQAYLNGTDPGCAIHDIHFRLEGPVVGHLGAIFADDWTFATGETLDGEAWFPPLQAAGDALARGLASGPDEDIERIRWAILSALHHATTRVRVVTPYFLPDRLLTTALVMAAMRGVAVEVLLPVRNNLRLVQWASKAGLADLVAAGVRIFETPPPFDHSKIMTVDGLWSLIGSANWDERSLRLNFELDVECYDETLATTLDRLIDGQKAAARPLTRDDLDGRSLGTRLRDGAAWLLSPYL